MEPLRVLEVLTEGCKELELAKTKFDAIGFNDIVSRIEQIQDEIYGRLGLTKEKEELKDNSTKKIVKTCPICGGQVLWCGDCLTEMDNPDPEKCTLYRELEKGFASKEKFAELLLDCRYCAYLSKIYCKTGDTKKIDWNELEESKEVEQPTESEDGKEPIIWITESVGYRYNKETDEFELIRKKPYGEIPFKRFRKSDLLKIWEDLPKRATRIDVEQVARKHGLKISHLAQYVMRIFTYVTFGGELKIEGKQLVLVKPDDFNLWEDAKRQLRAERELIDSKGWGK